MGNMANKDTNDINNYYMEDSYARMGDLYYGVEDKLIEYSPQVLEPKNLIQPQPITSMGNWNERYQELIDQPISEQREHQLGNFGKEFIREVSRTVKCIVDELSLNDETKRSILPTKLGGIAGGTKYLRNGIVYKMAVDDKGVYGTDESAMKVARHELKGALVLNLQNRDTLIYGSCDAGRHVHNETSPYFQQASELMQNIGKNTKIAPHYVEEKSTQKLKQVVGPVDLEIHYGLDDRFYAIDVARVLPPVQPTSFKKVRKASYLVYLFRPEFLQQATTPLNSDAYSPFSMEARKQIDEATQQLFAKIKKMAEELEKVRDVEKLCEQLDIPTWLHSQGVNLRYLGKMYSMFTSQRLKNFFLQEMVLRVLKDDLKTRLRSAILDASHSSVTATYLNNLFAPNDYDKSFWMNDVKLRIQQKYEDPLSDTEMDNNHDIRNRLDVNTLLFGIKKSVGILIYLKNQDELEQVKLPLKRKDDVDWSTLFPLTADQIQLSVILNHISYSTTSYADKLKQQAEVAKNFVELSHYSKPLNNLSQSMSFAALGVKKGVVKHQQVSPVQSIRHKEIQMQMVSHYNWRNDV